MTPERQQSIFKTLHDKGLLMPPFNDKHKFLNVLQEMQLDSSPVDTLEELHVFLTHLRKRGAISGAPDTEEEVMTMLRNQPELNDDNNPLKPTFRK